MKENRHSVKNVNGDKKFFKDTANKTKRINRNDNINRGGKVL